MPISLTEDVQRAPLLSIKNTGDQPHTDEFNASQGMKLHLTLGDQSPGADQLTSQLSLGNAEEYKRLLADRDVLSQVQTQNDILNSVMQSDPSAITPEVVQTIHGLSMMELQSPDLDSIVEKKYANLYTNTALATTGNDILDDAFQSDPESTHQMIDKTEGLAFKQQYAQKVLDSVTKESEDRPMFQKAWDLAEGLIPGVRQYQLYNAVDMGDFSNSILPSSNRADQYAFMWNISDPQEFKSTLDSVVSELKDRNLDVAQEWLQGLFSFGSSDAALENIFTGLDVASVVPLGKLGNVLKGVAKGASRNPTQIADIAQDLGKFADSGTARVIDDLKEGPSVFAGQNIRNLSKVEQSTPSIMSPEKLMTGAEKRGQAFYNRLKEAIQENATAATRFLTEPNRIDRAVPEELVQYRDDLMAQYKRNHPSIQKNVIDVEVNQGTDLGNVYQAKVILGKRDGSLFESEKQADNYMRRQIKGTDDYQIRQVGEGFQIEILKNVDETKFFDMKLQTSQTAPTTFGETFSGWWRSPNYTVSRENELARGTAVTSTEKLSSIFGTMAEPLARLSKKEYAELDDLLVQNTKGQFYYRNYEDFEKAFTERFKKNPSVEQAAAYMSNVQINDLDLWVRDLDVYKQKARLGIEDMTVNLMEDLPNGVTSPVTAKFEGKVIDDLPWVSPDKFSVSVIKDGKAGRPQWLMSKAFKEEVQKLREQGYKIIQVADGNFKVGDSSANYVITKNYKSDRIGLGNVPRREGGHQVHKYPYYIKQGKITSNGTNSFYRGDMTLLNARNEKGGLEAVRLFEEARQLVSKGDPNAVKFIRDNLPISPKEFFTAVQKGDINLSVPFALTKRGARTIDTGAYHGIPNLTDATKSEHNLSSRIMGRYLGSRDEVDINLIKSEGDILFEIQPAPYLSPLETLRMSSANMMNVSVMNDYMIKTNQDFLREFGDILKGTREEQASSGTSLLQDPVFKEGVTDEARKARAMNISRAYNHLANTRTPLQDKIESVKQKLLETVYPKTSGRIQQIVENKMLGQIKDPGVFFRSVAFDFKLGMFNPQQYFVQANQMVNVFALAGRDGLRGGLTYPITRAVLLSSNPEILKSAARKVERIGLMKAGEYEEAVALLKRSGFDHVGGDLAYLDELKAPELRKGPLGSTVGTFLKWGRTPFNEGEKVARLSGWIAAYLEKRKAIGTRALTRRDEAEILQRAKDLTSNMTRESNAAWQKGYGAVFTQFFGYQARIMEQMLGKKLTGAEKLRLFTGYSAMYGVPVAMGSVAGVIPVRDIIRDTLFENGVNPDDNPALDLFMDGFTSSFMNFMFDKDLNISARFGPGGLPTFYDLIRQDKNVAEVFLGASGSIMFDTVKSSIPALSAMWSEFRDFDGGLHNLRAEDFLAPLRNISSIDSMAKLYQVYNTGIWMSKNGTDMMKMDVPDAVIAALTGLQPGEIEDSFSKIRGMQGFKEWQNSQQKDFIKRYRQIMKMDDGATREKLTRELKAEVQMTFAGDLRKQAETWRYAYDNEMMNDSVNENYEKISKKMQSANTQTGE